MTYVLLYLLYSLRLFIVALDEKKKKGCEQGQLYCGGSVKWHA